jgi:hypothetical protein
MFVFRYSGLLSVGGSLAGVSVADGGAVFFIAARLRFLGALAFFSASVCFAFWAFISARSEEATPARDARSAISPSLVLGA